MRSYLAPIMAASALAGCHAQADIGDGNTVSRNYNVGNFSAIEVAGPYDVEVRTGSAASVSAQGGEKLLEHTDVKVDGDKLVIRPHRRGGLFSWGWTTHGSAKFVVTVPQLNGASIAGSGDIRVDKIAAPIFEGEIAGSGSLNLANLAVQQLKLSIAGSGGVKAAAGTADSAKYEIAGSGDIDAEGVQTKNLEASIAGSGGIKGHSSGTADVDVMGSGDVNITGGAKCKVSKAGSGNVSCA